MKNPLLAPQMDRTPWTPEGLREQGLVRVELPEAGVDRLVTLAFERMHENLWRKEDASQPRLRSGQPRCLGSVYGARHVWGTQCVNRARRYVVRGSSVVYFCGTHDPLRRWQRQEERHKRDREALKLRVRREADQKITTARRTIGTFLDRVTDEWRRYGAYTATRQWAVDAMRELADTYNVITDRFDGAPK